LNFEWVAGVSKVGEFVIPAAVANDRCGTAGAQASSSQGSSRQAAGRMNAGLLPVPPFEAVQWPRYMAHSFLANLPHNRPKIVPQAMSQKLLNR
jgi:hypothetical protein